MKGRAIGRELERMVRHRLPGLNGKPFHIRLVQDLSERVSKPVHAATHIPKREILLDSELLESRTELSRIVFHEVFHFGWVRLGNPRRLSYEALLQAELEGGAKGELGWSAEWRKLELTVFDRRNRSRKWREYVCESFCDTGAWAYAGLRSHPEWTLAPKYRKRRFTWLVRIIEEGDFRV